MLLSARSILFTICSVSLSSNLYSQVFDDFFREAIIRTDTVQYLYSVNNLSYNGQKHFYFPYEEASPVAEIELIPRETFSTDSLRLLPSGDFEIIDSLLNINKEFYRFKVRFTDLANSDFLRFTLALKDSSMDNTVVTELNLLPYTHSFVKFYPLSN